MHQCTFVKTVDWDGYTLGSRPPGIISHWDNRPGLMAYWEPVLLG